MKNTIVILPNGGSIDFNFLSKEYQEAILNNKLITNKMKKDIVIGDVVHGGTMV